jgi:hypothetical protein
MNDNVLCLHDRVEVGADLKAISHGRDQWSATGEKVTLCDARRRIPHEEESAAIAQHRRSVVT